jgi:type IV pilus assembly protein PilX
MNSSLQKSGFRTQAQACAGNQGGAALLVALMMLLIITLIGIAAARTQTLEVRLSSNLQNRNIAVQSGEAALRNAESGLLQSIYTSFASNQNGLYLVDASVTQPWYSNTAVVWSSSSTTVLPYSNSAGTATNNGPSIASDDAAQPALYIIEQLPAITVPGESVATTTYGAGVPPSATYRITVKAVGGDTTSLVTLQTIFH